MIYTAAIGTPLGEMTASAENDAVTGLWFVGQKYYPSETEAWLKDPGLEIFDALRNWLEDYFSGGSGAALPALSPKGTTFQSAVWKRLLAIPRGRVTTYGEIAKSLAAQMGIGSMSAQAVGGAVGHNPISVLIPCHRVIGCSGSLTGYAGGLERKKMLLALEGADAADRVNYLKFS